MHLVVVGISHKTASISLRERFTIESGDLHTALDTLRAHPHITEVCIVSTCNRIELYAVTQTKSDDDILIEFLADCAGIQRADVETIAYRMPGHHAVRHLFEVACGLDSMAFGETQILGQIKDAYCAAGECTSTILNNLFQRAITAGKRARTETAISCGTFSIGAAAAQLAKIVLGDLTGRAGLILGSGEMSKLAAVHLRSNGVGRMYFANRTREKIEPLAQSLSGEIVDFDIFDKILRSVDFVISSTAAPSPIITKNLIENVMRERSHAPLFLIDIAVPRDIESGVAGVDGVFVYNIDDLQFFVDRCNAERENEVGKVHRIVDEETASFMEFLRTLEAVPLIKQLRDKFESVYISEWAKCEARLSHLPAEEREQIRKALQSVSKKLSHDPILAMKEYSANDGREKLDIAREIFGLEET